MKKIIKNPIFWIFLLALILRLFKLESFPNGFHVDEIKAGWNGLSIIETLRDDKLNLLPLYYNTFGDYRPTGIFYFTAPFVYLLGNTIFATRLSSSIFGAATVIIIYLIVNLMEKNIKNEIKDLKAGVWTSLVLAVMPWHIEVSRATSEVVISLFFLSLSIYFLLKLIYNFDKKYIYYYLTSLVASYFLYHSVRVSAPIFAAAIAIYFYRKIKKIAVKRSLIICVLATTLLSLFISLESSSRERFGQVSIFKDKDVVYEIERLKEENQGRNIIFRLVDNKSVVYIRNLAHEYGRYFSSDFLIGNTAKPYRYTVPAIGLLHFSEIIFLVLGVYYLISQKKNYLFIILLILSPLTSSLTTEDSPNLHRALLMVPFLAIIEGYGIINTLSWKRKYFVIKIKHYLSLTKEK